MCRFPARESPVADLVAGGGVDGAVPFQDTKWALVGKRVMSPTSPAAGPRRRGRFRADFGVFFARAEALLPMDAGPSDALAQLDYALSNVMPAEVP
jgi:hypothetical protein